MLHFRKIKRWWLTFSHSYSTLSFSFSPPWKRAKCSLKHFKVSKIFPRKHAPGPPYKFVSSFSIRTPWTPPPPHEKSRLRARGVMQLEKWGGSILAARFRSPTRLLLCHSVLPLILHWYTGLRKRKRRLAVYRLKLETSAIHQTLQAKKKHINLCWWNPYSAYSSMEFLKR